MPAAAPHDDLRGFPPCFVAVGAEVFRIVLARDPDTGAIRAPWYYSSATAGPTSGPGRFDLPFREGSCYSSDRRYGAWLEVFRACGLVDRLDVERRRLVIALRRDRRMRLADLRSSEARHYGVTADLIAGDNYELPQQWAAALAEVGYPGLSATARHDPTHVARNIVLFGRSGPRQRLAHWWTSVRRLIDDDLMFTELPPFGTGTLPRPYDVPTTTPP